MFYKRLPSLSPQPGFEDSIGMAALPPQPHSAPRHLKLQESPVAPPRGPPSTLAVLLVLCLLSRMDWRSSSSNRQLKAMLTSMASP